MEIFFIGGAYYLFFWGIKELIHIGNTYEVLQDIQKIGSSTSFWILNQKLRKKNFIQWIPLLNVLAECLFTFYYQVNKSSVLFQLQGMNVLKREEKVEKLSEDQTIYSNETYLNDLSVSKPLTLERKLKK